MSQFFKTREETKAWLDEMEINKYTINDDLSVDVDESLDVDISGMGLTAIPVRFGVVLGNFDCSDNQLVSLAGSPREVGWSFRCDYNQLTSLEGSPEKVVGHFICSHNQLNDLQGSPQEVRGGFICSHNQLTSLQGSPEKVGADFICDGNINLRDVGAWRDHQVSGVSGFRGPSEEEVAKNKAIYERELLSKVAEQTTIERPVTPVRSRVM